MAHAHHALTAPGESGHSAGMNLDADIALALRLADAAGDAIRPHFRSGLTSERKGDATPVTLADRAAEEVMRRILTAEVPRDTVIGEEFGATAGTSARSWVLDPIDGTTSFLVGRPTTLNGKPARTRLCPTLADATLATTGPHYFDDHQGAHFMGLAAKTDHRRMVMGGDCYNYALLASGYIDVVCEANLKLHDWAALVPIVEGAGGTMCDWNGDPLHAGSDGHVLALGDPARLEDVVEALACGH